MVNHKSKFNLKKKIIYHIPLKISDYLTKTTLPLLTYILVFITYLPNCYSHQYINHH